jgi:hypothetical protein
MNKLSFKLLKSMLLILVLVLFSEIKAQTVDFNLDNGLTINYQAEDIRKITFDNDLMNVLLWDGSLFSMNVSTINSFLNNSSLSTQELLNELNTMNLQLYPNPTNDQININYSTLINDEISILIYDSNSKLMMNRKLTYKSSGKYTEVIDLSTLVAGTYFCQITENNKKIVRQFIKK